MNELISAMRAGARRLAWLCLLACLVFAIGGCYSSDYGRQTAATATMLRDLAQKLGDYCRAGFRTGGRDVSSEEMGEFYYGLKKARSYAAQAAANSSRQSYRDLTRLIDEYHQMLTEADRYRLAGQPNAQQLQDIVARQKQVTARAESVIADLHREQ